MADLAAGDVTYTLIKQRIYNSRKHNLVRLAFGDGALTYPANGIPISKGKLGCPNNVESLHIVDQGTSGYIFNYDQSAEKLVIIQSPVRSHAHDFLVKGGTAAAGTDALNIKSTIIGKESALDATNLAADVATKGGVQSATLAAAALSEATAVAIAAQTIEVEVIGW